MNKTIIKLFFLTFIYNWYQYTLAIIPLVVYDYVLVYHQMLICALVELCLYQHFGRNIRKR